MILPASNQPDRRITIHGHDAWGQTTTHSKAAVIASPQGEAIQRGGCLCLDCFGASRLTMTAVPATHGDRHPLTGDRPLLGGQALAYRGPPTGGQTPPARDRPPEVAVIASPQGEAIQRGGCLCLDCFGASRLAMTAVPAMHGDRHPLTGVRHLPAGDSPPEAIVIASPQAASVLDCFGAMRLAMTPVPATHGDRHPLTGDSPLLGDSPSCKGLSLLRTVPEKSPRPVFPAFNTRGLP
jgi:hypothetical protein